MARSIGCTPTFSPLKRPSRCAWTGCSSSEILGSGPIRRKSIARRRDTTAPAIFRDGFKSTTQRQEETLFIKGNHEDFDWLAAQKSSEILPNLHYLRNGQVFEITAGSEAVRVAGIGGCYGPSNYQRVSTSLYGSARRHYARVTKQKHFSMSAASTSYSRVRSHAFAFLRTIMFASIRRLAACRALGSTKWPCRAAVIRTNCRTSLPCMPSSITSRMNGKCSFRRWKS